MIVYVENTKESSLKRLIELIKELNKVVGYKVNI